MVGRSSAGRGIVGRGRGRGVVGSGRSRGAGGFHGRDSTILGSPGRGCTTLGSRGRGSVGGSPGRGSIGGSSCRGSAVGGSPGRGSGVLGFLGRGSNVGGTPTTSSSGHGNDMADYEHHGLFEEGMDGINTNEEEISEGGGGSNDFPSNPSLRKWVFVTEDGARFNDGGDIARDITEILKNMYNGVWPTWGKIPEVEKEKLYERFKKFYQWDPDNERCVKKIWQKHISKKLSGHLFEARRIAEEKARALGMDVDNDYTTIIPFNPTWIKQEFWRKLVQEHWNLDKWQAVSEANKANRAQFVEGYHTTGSVGYDVARRRFVRSTNCC